MIFTASQPACALPAEHIGWYLDPLPGGEAARREINRLDSAAAQYDAVAAFLAQLPQYADVGHALIGADGCRPDVQLFFRRP